MAEQATDYARGVPIMLPKDVPLPAFFRIVDQKSAIIQHYQPAALNEGERELLRELTQAVRLALVWLNSQHPTNEALRHAVADTKERMSAVLAKAGALGVETRDG